MTSITGDLKELLADLKELRKIIKNEDGERISKQNLRSRAEGLSNSWFSGILIRISKNEAITKENADKYSNGFSRLLKLTSPANRKSSYLETLDLLIKGFQEELIMPLITNPDTKAPKGFEEIFENIKDIPEKDYLEEALGCAENGFNRAAAVLGWSSVIFRLHRVIEKEGFDKFNEASSRISALNYGRFKRFNKTFRIHDANDLNEVFDTDLLWVIEGMSLIDMNEHTRLRGCFDLRCQGAHPGNAPITDYNLLSFFSDINEIIFKNVRFK